MPTPQQARAIAEQAWSWVLSQVRYDELGPWIPESVSVDGTPSPLEERYRDCTYQGLGSLALTLDEIARYREWTIDEMRLANEILTRLSVASDDSQDPGLSLGVGSHLAAMHVLGVDPVGIDRIAALATADGWVEVENEETLICFDLLVGTAGVGLTLTWLAEVGFSATPSTTPLINLAVDTLLANALPSAKGLQWPMYADDTWGMMPNYSHGTAGVSAALAICGKHLGRQDAIDAAAAGARHLIDIGDTSNDGFRVQTIIPKGDRDIEDFAYGWCHGPTGTSHLFSALEYAGVESVGGVSCDEWVKRCLNAIRTSGVPKRVRPGFWDNDGRCCGTAGVLDFALDVIQRHPEGADFTYADELAQALVDRAIMDPALGHTYWRFTEHRREQPLLDPGVGWMQGAAGIAGALMRYSRVRTDPAAATRQSRPEAWWMA